MRVEVGRAEVKLKPTLTKPRSSSKSVKEMLIALTTGVKTNRKLNQQTLVTSSEDVQPQDPATQRSEGETLIGAIRGEVIGRKEEGSATGVRRGQEQVEGQVPGPDSSGLEAKPAHQLGKETPEEG